MSNIVSWEYYNSLHSVATTQAEFTKYEALAEKEVRQVIGKIRFDGITSDTFGYDVLKDCICNVIDKLIQDEASGRGQGITSVSNDGYSESYANGTSADLLNDMSSSIKAWLSGTGLVGAY